MELTIDTEGIRQAAETAVTNAVAGAIGSWSITSAVTEAASEVVLELDLPTMVQDELRAVLNRDGTRIVQDAIRLAADRLTVALGAAVGQVSVAMAYGILVGKPGSYDTEKAAIWQKAEAMAGIVDPVGTLAGE